jgi:ABC-type Na+ efflux pump permease subunit
MSGAPLPPPVAPGERPEAPPLAEAAGQIMVRHASGAFRGKRFLAAAALVALAPLLAVLIRNPAPEPLVRIVLHLHLAFLLPLLAISLGSGILHEEAEQGTLTYLFTAPVPRAAVVLGKWAGALACGWGLALLSLGAVFLLSPAELPGGSGFVRAAFLATILGLPAYLGLFTFLGTLFRHGYIAGLLYCYGFELIVWVMPGAMKRLAVGFYTRSLLEPHIPDKAPLEGYFHGFPPDATGTCAAVLALAAAAALAATLLVTPRKEFRAKNVQG